MADRPRGKEEMDNSKTEVSRTEVLGDNTLRAPAEGTLVRPPPAPSESTSVHSPDRTVRSGAAEEDATSLRPARASAQDAALTDEDATRRVGGADTAQPSVTLLTDEDATVQTRRDAPVGTAQRTLRMPTGGAAAYAPTLKTPQAQQTPQQTLIDDRPGRQLSEESVHHGQLQPGSIIKQRFVLDTMIGKGGMGLVFAAIDRRKEEAKDPNPRVALKVLNADFQRHPQSFMALQREARKAQTLAHPNVVTVFDFDRDGDAVYMTMELLTGRSLESIVRNARGKGIGREAALPIIRGIAEGLAYAHRKGIVHSDLKPGNVFVCNDDTPKILDFGIARAVPSSIADENDDVFDAGSLGAYTEAYATDEMVDGIDPHPADDLYALGIIGYELLIGFHPYQRHSAPNARKLGLKPPPLKGLKRREAQALERCLSFDRKNRPRDAGEFLKLFRGVTALQQATLAATVVLALISGYLWYENYRETSPAIPFSELPLQKRQEFTEYMKHGDEEWAFYARENNPAALEGALLNYAGAYDTHPRNRDAVHALRRAADAALETAAPDQRKATAEYLQNRSDYYRKYGPVVDAAK
jgi:serine/threonine protein kinase